MSLELFYHLYYENEEFPFPEMETYLSQFHFQDIIPIRSGNGNRELLFTLTSLNSDLGEPSATIGIRMGADVLTEENCVGKMGRADAVPDSGQPEPDPQYH